MTTIQNIIHDVNSSVVSLESNVESLNTSLIKLRTNIENECNTCTATDKLEAHFDTDNVR